LSKGLLLSIAVSEKGAKVSYEINKKKSKN